ncbi:hypothetical protein IG197_34465 (plasmid) [Aminobacter sp. SR38]|uniref:ATP-binding cassette domain-containing protein n=1 Tax=Aminobacter sp. SR38 TaxID=2774562 RepID=UPI001786BB9B|nr:ATP-binding cassette domain-containing protein [Aminobacter sp. SR38]QOF75480.1 hypothetical protein IG197_34465 [Aminobacter sp. SR38]
MTARAVELLDYHEVGHRKHAMPVSGDEAQRVAPARALANPPRIILADEPTAPLNSARARIVMNLLRRDRDRPERDHRRRHP